MKKIKNILISLALLSLGSSFALSITPSKVNEPIVETKAEDQLPVNEFKKIASGWNPNQTNLANDPSFCYYVLEFKNNWLSDGGKRDENLTSSIGTHITINGTTIEDKEDKIKVSLEHAGKYFGLKIRTDLVVASTGSENCIIHIDGGTPFYEYSLPDMTLTVELTNYTAVAKVTPIKQNVSFVKFCWENTLYGYEKNKDLFESEYEPNPTIIDSGKNAVPKNGYVCLLEFSLVDTEFNTEKTANFAYDPNYEFSTKMRVNGEQVKDLEGIKVNKHEGFLYIYIPDSALKNKSTYMYPRVSFEEGIEIGYMILPRLKFQFNNTLGSRNGWKLLTVNNTGIVWNKENKDSELFGNKKGLLVSLDSNLAASTTDNIVQDYGQFVTLNGAKFNTLTNPEMRVYKGNNLWLYADEFNSMSLEKNTLTVNMFDYGDNKVNGFTYYSKSGENYYWTSKINDNPRIITLSVDNLYYDSKTDSYGSAWPSNHVYEGTGNHNYCGGNYDSGKKYGYLLSFATHTESEANKFIYLSNTGSESNGGMKYVNLCKEDIGHHVFSNGVPFCDIEGAEIMYHSQGNIWFYTPTMTAPLSGKNHAELTIDDNAYFFDSKLPEMKVVHADLYDFSKLKNANLWHIVGLTGKYAYTIPADRNDNYLKLDEKTPSDNTWLGPYTWNNHDGDGTTIIAYGNNEADTKERDTDPDFITTYLKSDGISDMNNLASRDFAIGSNLTLNGIPLCDIDDTQINYQNGENFLSFIIPERMCKPFNGYKVPTLKLVDGTNFFDSCLEGFTIYFKDGKWQKESVDFIEDSEVSQAIKYSDVFDVTTLNDSVNELSGSTSEIGGSFAFEFRSSSSSAAFALNLFGTNSNNGINILFDYKNQNAVLTDLTGTSCAIGNGSYNAKLEIEEWTRAYLKYAVNGNIANFVFAIDDIVIYKNAYLNIDSIDGLGKSITLYSNGEIIEFRDVHFGGSIKLPKIQYSGKDLYRLHVGDLMPDLSGFFNAYDNLDDISNRVVINYPEEMFDANRKVVKGSFTVVASVTNDAGTTKNKEIYVIVTDPNEVVVTFDGKNPTVYTIGDCIERPSYTPFKEAEGYSTYEFIGWVTESGEDWDFENYYVTQDLNLVSLFKEYVTSFTVNINVAGADVSSYSFIMTAGSSLDVLVFEKEGYEVKMTYNGEEVKSIVINNNISIDVTYTKLTSDEEETKKGCRGAIIGTSLIVSMTSGLGALLSLKKRKEDK